MADNERIELGALWKKRSERIGNEYFTGDIKTPSGDVIKVIGFTNDRKTKENQPDIRIYLQEERSGGGGYSKPAGNTYQKPASTYSRPAPAATPAPAPIEYPTEDIDPDDIPF